MADLLYIHSDAGEGSVEFVDLSGNDIALTANGDVKHSTTQKKFGATSIAFDGTGDYITAPNQASLRFGSSDFTVDMWVRVANITQFHPLISQADDTVNGWLIDVNSTGYPRLVSDITGSWGVSLQSSTALTAGVWAHIAVVRNGTDLRLYLNGVSVANLTTSASFTDNTTDNLLVGYYQTSAPSDRYLNGYIAELRITNTAEWTTAFTPPRTAYLSKDSYYNLVMANSPCNYWRLGEASGNALDERGEHNLTWAGTPVYEATGALVNDTDTAMTLDGSTEYVSKTVSDYRGSDTAGSIECWVKTSSLLWGIVFGGFEGTDASDRVSLGISPDGEVSLYTDTNGTGNGVKTTETGFNDGAYHFIVVVSNGSAWSIYVDGVSKSLTLTAGTNNGNWFGDIAGTLSVLLLGAQDLGASLSAFFNGSIDEVAVYDYPLSPQQIWRHYIEGSHLKETGTRYEHRILMSKPVNYWRLDEASGNAVDEMGEHDLTWA